MALSNLVAMKVAYMLPVTFHLRVKINERLVVRMTQIKIRIFFILSVVIT